MSAFLCSERHLARIASWAAAENLADVHADDPVQLCIILRRLNNAAMAARYGDTAEPLQDLGQALQDEAARPAPTAAEALALLKCLDYQCSEGDVMESHPDRGILLALVFEAEEKAPNRQPAAGVWSI